MIPTLPQNDTAPDARALALAASRAEVDFDRSRGGMCLPDRVPPAQAFTREWAFQAVLLGEEAEALDAAGALRVALDGPDLPEEKEIALAKAVDQAIMQRQIKPVCPPFRALPPTARTPLTIAEHALLFGELPLTEGVARWNEDAYFAWQRIGCDNPGVIRLVTPEDWTALASKMPLDPLVFERVRPGDTLDRAVDEHRLFVCDHVICDGIDAGFHGGWRRWLPAAIALFATDAERRQLWPVAIQCGQVPNDTCPILTPLDGVAWTMAKAAFNATDSTYHGVSEHGALCHLMLGAISVATMRTLAPYHPVRILLRPHLDMTLAIAAATAELYVPGGRTPTLQSISVDGICELTRRTWKHFDWYNGTLERNFGSRGLGGTDVLRELPARDDLALYTDAIRRFATSYTTIYYARDSDVVGDTELQEWVRVIRSPEGADIPTFTGPKETVSTVAELADLLAGVIWRASPWHCIINYAVYETTAFAPAYPASLFAPPPRKGQSYVESDLLYMLPPESVVRGLFVDLVQVSSLRENRLGHYTPETFTDYRVHGLLDRLRLDLSGIARRISERNRFRPIPFPFLEPDLTTASTHI